MNSINKFSHPGFQRGQGRPQNKGRQVDQGALLLVQKLLGDCSRSRDHLLENLHRLNDHFGYLDYPHLCALAHEMKLAQSEVYEVASFYAHFHLVKEEETPPSGTLVRVCHSLSCQLAGAEALANNIKAMPGARLEMVPCVGRCDVAPIAVVGQNAVTKAEAVTVRDAVEKQQTAAHQWHYETLDQAMARGLYATLQQLTDTPTTAETMAQTLLDSGLKGMGGAGFPTGRKWQLVRAEHGRKLMCVNGDEGEVGTFKDHYYLRHHLHEFIEGMLIAAQVVEAEAVYIYLRDEYPDAHITLQRALDEVAAAGITPCPVYLRRGAGAYICGEESAMIESIEGKRPLPRHRPPFVAQVGLFGQPTLVNNIETLFWARQILSGNDQGFTAQGRHGGRGWRSYSVSGRVQNPGVKVAPAGITVRELIDEYCGGMLSGHTLKGYLPGGASGGILPASLADEPLEFGTLQQHGCFIGSAAIVVLSDHDNIAEAALNLMQFFAHESCGQCTPCRVGTEKAVMMMGSDHWDQETLRDLCTVMTDASICGLGQAAGNPLICTMTYFPDDVPGAKK